MKCATFQSDTSVSPSSIFNVIFSADPLVNFLCLAGFDHFVEGSVQKASDNT
ncbi:hypothetical protein PI125_g24279 [Phytophthora idaei]|nr:hypothetical protein PI125_g24279 [Phytophthora idaei]